jgi:hypothetical protein
MKPIVRCLIAMSVWMVARPAASAPPTYIAADGTVQSAWHIGGNAGPTLTNASGVITGITRVNSIDYPAGGSLSTGCVLQASGASSAACSAVNLALAASVTGVLPSGNQANQTLTGDVTGNTGASVVSAITGSTPISITPLTLQWLKTTSGPVLGQAAQTTDTATFSLNLSPQAPFASATGSNRAPGNLSINIAAPTNSGSTEAGVNLFRGATLVGQWGPTNTGATDFWLFPQATPIAPSANNAIIQSSAGSLILGPDSAGNIELRANTVGSAGIFLVSGATGVQLGGESTTFGGGVKVVGMTNAGTIPTSNPSGGGAFYSNAGGGAWRGSGGGITNFAAIGVGSQNTQQGLVDDSYMSFVRTVSTASPTAFTAYTTISNTGGFMHCRLTSKAATTGTGVAIGNLSSSEYLLAYQNISGTVTLSTGGVQLVSGSNQTTAAALTAPVMTASASTNTVVPSVTNVNLATIDSQIACTIDVN